MSYEPTVWKDGDLVTSAKLNKLEQGVANGVNFEIIHMEISPQGFSLDKTAGEIIDMLKSGKHILVIYTPVPPSDQYEECMQFSAIPARVVYTPGSGLGSGFQMSLYLSIFDNNDMGLVDLTASSLDQYPSFNR